MTALQGLRPPSWPRDALRLARLLVTLKTPHDRSAASAISIQLRQHSGIFDSIATALAPCREASDVAAIAHHVMTRPTVQLGEAGRES